jgi:hypothetical protein
MDMEIASLGNVAINWEEIQAEKIHGESGFVVCKTKEIGSLTIRHNTYSENFRAESWCEKEHILLVLNGVLLIEFKDGSSVTVTKGNSYVLAERGQAHRASTLEPAEVFIVE